MRLKRWNISSLFFMGITLISCNTSGTVENIATSDTTQEIMSMSKVAVENSENRNSPIEKMDVEIKTFQTDKGWGYDIYVSGKLYIHQPHIPAVSGNNGFKNEEDAKKVAQLMIYKLEHHISPPSVTSKEIDSLIAVK